MNQLPVKVSIIIPAYNAAEYLSACLSSCVQQTLFDIEIICVDDGSTDATPEIIREYMKQDFRIQLVSKANGGLSSARNAGIDHACGDMIMFLDSDDYLSENACERVWIESRECPADIITFGTVVFPDVPPAEPWYYWALSVDPGRFYEFTPDLLFHNRSSLPFVWRQAYRHSFLKKNELLFDETVRFGEDTVFQMEAFPHASCFAYIPDNLYHYRHFRKGSLMYVAEKEPEKWLDEHIYITETVTKYWDKQGWLKQYPAEYTDWLVSFIFNTKGGKELAKLTKEQQKKVDALLKKYGLDTELKRELLENKEVAKRYKKSITRYLSCI